MYLFSAISLETAHYFPFSIELPSEALEQNKEKTFGILEVYVGVKWALCTKIGRAITAIMYNLSFSMDPYNTSTLVGNSNEPPRKNVESLSEKDT